jgi:hypothetical protein
MVMGINPETKTKTKTEETLVLASNESSHKETGQGIDGNWKRSQCRNHC